MTPPPTFIDSLGENKIEGLWRWGRTASYDKRIRWTEGGREFKAGQPLHPWNSTKLFGPLYFFLRLGPCPRHITKTLYHKGRPPVFDFMSQTSYIALRWIRIIHRWQLRHSLSITEYAFRVSLFCKEACECEMRVTRPLLSFGLYRLGRSWRFPRWLDLFQGWTAGQWDCESINLLTDQGVYTFCSPKTEHMIDIEWDWPRTTPSTLRFRSES